MSAVVAIVRREVKSYFVSPLAYTAISVFLAFQGVLFFFAMLSYDRQRLAAAQNPLMTVPGAESIVRGMLGSDVIWTLLVIVPLLTMRLLAEERKQHTAELLLTAPITTRQLVTGKFFGSVVVLVTMLALSVWMPALLVVWGGIDPAPIYGGYIGALLYGSFLLAVGLLASSLTDSTMISAFMAFLMMGLINVLGPLASKVPWIGGELERLTPSAHLGTLASGVIDTHALIFFAAGIMFLLDLTSRVLDSQRWR